MGHSFSGAWVSGFHAAWILRLLVSLLQSAAAVFSLLGTVMGLGSWHLEASLAYGSRLGEVSARMCCGHAFCLQSLPIF